MHDETRDELRTRRMSKKKIKRVTAEKVMLKLTGSPSFNCYLEGWCNGKGIRIHMPTLDNVRRALNNLRHYKKRIYKITTLESEPDSLIIERGEAVGDQYVSMLIALTNGSGVTKATIHTTCMPCEDKSQTLIVKDFDADEWATQAMREYHVEPASKEDVRHQERDADAMRGSEDDDLPAVGEENRAIDFEYSGDLAEHHQSVFVTDEVSTDDVVEQLTEIQQKIEDDQIVTRISMKVGVDLPDFVITLHGSWPKDDQLHVHFDKSTPSVVWDVEQLKECFEKVGYVSSVEVIPSVEDHEDPSQFAAVCIYFDTDYNQSYILPRFNVATTADFPQLRVQSYSKADMMEKVAAGMKIVALRTSILQVVTTALSLPDTFDDDDIVRIGNLAFELYEASLSHLPTDESIHTFYSLESSLGGGRESWVRVAYRAWELGANM